MNNKRTQFLFIISDCEKRPVNSGSSSIGDEPGLCQNPGLTALNAAANIALNTNCNDDGEYVPTVGRWGAEWPS